MSTADNDTSFKELVAHLTGQRLSKQWLNFKLKQNRETSTKETHQSYLTMWSKTNFVNEVIGLKIPIRIIVGEYDHEAFRADVIKKTFLHWFPQSELVICKNAGHFSVQETPVYIASKIEEYMLKHMNR